MNWLNKLQEEKTIRETYEKDQLRLKMAINTINDYHAAYNGEFLTKLEEFLKTYTNEQKI